MPIAPKTEPGTRRFSLGLGHALFLAVLGLRLWSLIRLTHSPLLIPAGGDMHFYNDWAKRILHGEFHQHLAFYGLPGYAYFLAAVYKVFGENPFVPGIVQALLEAGTALLIYRLVVGIFGPTSSSWSNKVDPRFAALFAAL